MKKGVKICTEFIWVIGGPVLGSCEHGNETSDSIEGRKFLNQPSNY